MAGTIKELDDPPKALPTHILHTDERKDERIAVTMVIGRLLGPSEPG